MTAPSFCPAEKNSKKPQKLFLDASFCSPTMDRGNWTTHNSAYHQLHYSRNAK